MNFKFKYVPALRYRQEEKGALNALAQHITSKTLPLIEIVKETPNIRSTKSFEEIYSKELDALQMPFLLDFPMYLPLAKSTIVEVTNFLTAVQADVKVIKIHTISSHPGQINEF
ncbi:MAG: hypothetical protein SCK28_10290 [Bacillota bacterium]|nr:hypothetical protein [Bacillota bacterium]